MKKLPSTKRFKDKEVRFVQGLDGNYHALAKCEVSKGYFTVPLTKDQAHVLCASDSFSLPDLFPISMPEGASHITSKNVESFLSIPNFRAQRLFQHGQTPGELFSGLHLNQMSEQRAEMARVDLSESLGYLRAVSDLERRGSSEQPVPKEKRAKNYTLAGEKLIVFEPATIGTCTAKCFCNEFECEVRVPLEIEQMHELLSPDRGRIQDILPEMDTRVREIFVSGITPAEFDGIFSGKPKSRDVYDDLGYKPLQERHPRVPTKEELPESLQSFEDDHDFDQE